MPKRLVANKKNALLCFLVCIVTHTSRVDSQKKISGVGRTILLILVIFHPCVLRAEVNLERPGAYYFGDSGSLSQADGVIGPDDLNALRSISLLGTALADSYSGVRPPNPLVQDVDGDNGIGPSDLALLRNWVLGLWGQGYTGRPAEVRLITSSTSGRASVKFFTSGSACAGLTTQVSAYVPSDAEAGIAGGRLNSRISTSSPIIVSYGAPVSCQRFSFDQTAPALLAEKDLLIVTVNCERPDLATYDCTSDAVFTVEGELSHAANVIQAGEVPGGAGGSGLVRAKVADCLEPHQSLAVVVENDDSVVSTLITGAPPSAAK